MLNHPPSWHRTQLQRPAPPLLRSLPVEVRCCAAGAAIPPPAMLIDDTLVAPGDGVILSPEDISAILQHRLPESDVAELSRLLETTQEGWGGDLAADD